MSRQRGLGWVRPTGTKTKVWTGFWNEYDGEGNRTERSKVLGRRSDMTKQDAREALSALMRTPAEYAKSTTWEQACTRYLTTRKPTWGRKFQRTIQSIFDKHILKALGGPVKTINTSTVQMALNQKITSDLSESLVRSGSRTFAASSKCWWMTTNSARTQQRKRAYPRTD